MSSVSPPAMSLSPLLFEDASDARTDLRTLVDISRRRAERTPHHPAYTFLVDGDTTEANFTYRQLDVRARAIAAHLQKQGAAGERVLLVFDPGLDYVAAIVGCFYAGAIAVPVYPPDPFRLARTLPRLKAVVKNAEARFLLSTRTVLGDPGGPLWEICHEGTIPLEDICEVESEDWRPLDSDPRRVALLQYTSGSTGEPRGVTLTHANLMHNLSALFDRMYVPDAVGVHWLPPYHDMGLIGGILLPLYAGRRTVLMSPLAFMQRPARWLEAIHRYRGTTSGGPNFAYDLCVRKIKPEECVGLDLSSWRVTVNGAEPVRAETLARFVEKFAPYGLPPTAPLPAYGMAETTLIIAGTGIEAQPTAHTFHAKALGANHVQPVAPDHPDARRLVSCGFPVLDVEVKIVDPDTCRPMSRGGVGEIWVRSPSVGQGYWNRPEETRRTFQATLPGDRGGPYLRTGDLGFLYEGQVYVVGRLKELIILAGRNFFPHDIERGLQDSHPALKADGGAAFSVDVDDEERLVLVQEVVRPKRYDLDEVLAAMRRTLAEQFDLAAYAIALIPSGSLPKTSSGKTRRRQCREDFLAGRLNVLRLWKADPDAAMGQSAAAEPPQTETETRLAALWRELLGLEEVGRQSDFFALGAQSLRVAQLLSRITAEFGAEVPLRRLFEDPTLAGMAAAVDAALSGSPRRDQAPALRAIPRSETAGPHPLSFSQQRLWFLENMGEGAAAAHVPLVLRLSGPLNPDALRAALGDLAARHDMLRARCFVLDGAPVQEIQAEVELPFECVDLSACELAEREQRLREVKDRWINEPFHLAAAPLARAGLVTLSADSHVLALVLHHVICDGWSVEILLRDLQIAYQARQQGEAPAWTSAPLRYVDYIRWRQDTWTADKQERELTYWKTRLEGAPQSLDLPTDRPRTLDGTPQPESTVRRLPPSLFEALQKLAREHGATPFMVHLAAFQAVLSRYAGRDDVCVGTAVAGRARPEVEDTVGCFINTVALRGDLSGDPAFHELLQRTRNSALEDLQHGDAPWEKVIEALQPQRRLGAAPLVQAFFLQQTPSQPIEFLGEARIAAAESDYSGLTVFDVSLVVEPRGDGWQAALVYDGRVFDNSTIAAMLDAYLAVLEQAAAQPTTPLSELPIPAPHDRQTLLEAWNATAMPLPPAEGFHELFEIQAERTPEAIAIQTDDSAWSYAELNRRAEQIAQALQHVGVGVNTPVGVHLTRRPELVAALLGVAKAGGVYVPLDPEYPASRLKFMLDDCAAAVVLTEAALSAALPPCDAFRIELEELLTGGSREIASAAATNGHRHNGHTNGSPKTGRVANEDRLAYLIYTSGSTGAPKGVMVPHRALVNFLASMAREPGLSPHDTMLASTTVSFDIAALELFLPLSIGGKLVLASRETATDGRALAGLIERQRINVMQATPAGYRMLLSSGWRPAQGMKLLVGGEALNADLASRLLQDDVELWNMYGPTETTVWSAVHRVTKVEDPMPIGRPIANTQLYVLDAHGRLAPRGAVGELCIGGLGVAAGYWNRPELTEERFLRNPFVAERAHQPCPACSARLAGRNGGSEKDGSPRTSSPPRMYKTGDLVRWRSDGCVEYLGRADSQVKIRGFRIELGEIEAALSTHPAVQEAAVTAPSDASGERRLVAYYAFRAGQTAAAEELRRHLAERLPPYMTPTAMIELSALPHTPAGKIDRKALPAPEEANLATSTPFVAPRTPLEEEIAAAWQEVLGLERVGVEDSFFELGGHSLLAAQLNSRLRERLQIELPLREFYRRPTVAALAEAVVRLRVQREDQIEISQLLDRLESMSDEEAAAFLQNRPELS